MKNNFILNRQERVWGYTIPSLDNTSLVRTGFSTRVGEVIKGNRESALDFCNSLGIYPEDLKFCGQVHGSKVVDARGEDSKDADGLVTDIKGLALVTFYADCVPLYFLDMKNRAIGLSHAGWKGTVGHIGQTTLETMERLYGTDPKDCVVAIGPSIDSCCFEVDRPVADRFKEAFTFSQDIMEYRGEGKYHIDLPEANKRALQVHGVPRENIYKSQICTSCNTDILYSYRREGGTPKRMAAVIMLV